MSLSATSLPDSSVPSTAVVNLGGLIGTGPAQPPVPTDRFPNNATAACPSGLGWVEKKRGYKNDFVRWAKFGMETMAVICHHEKGENYYYSVSATDIKSYGEKGFTRLIGKRYQTDWEKAAVRAKSKQVQHGIAAGIGGWNTIIKLAERQKALLKEVNEDAAELNADLGGDGMQERVPSVGEMPSLSGQCDICGVTKTSGIQVMPCCKGFKACLKCILKIADDKAECPHCRTLLPMPPVPPDGSSDDESFLEQCCFVCNQPAPPDRVACDVADCPKVICIDCNKTTITSAMINDTSIHFCCPDHHNHATLGYIKLEACTATTSVPTTASDRAARMEKKKQAADAGSSSKDNGSCSVPPKKKMKNIIRITARVASCAKFLRKHYSKENIIGLAQNLDVATVHRFGSVDGGKRMMRRRSLQRIAVLLAKKLTGE